MVIYQTHWTSLLYVTEQLHCIVYNLELTLRQWSDLLTIFPTRWHLKVLNYVCFLTYTCEWYAQDSLKKYPDSYLSSWQQVTRSCASISNDLPCLEIHRFVNTPFSQIVILRKLTISWFMWGALNPVIYSMLFQSPQKVYMIKHLSVMPIYLWNIILSVCLENQLYSSYFLLFYFENKFNFFSRDEQEQVFLLFF